MNKKGFGIRKFFIEQDFGACSSVGRHEEVHTGNVILTKRESLSTMSVEDDRSCAVIKGNSSSVFRNVTDMAGKKNTSWRLRSKRSASSPSHRDSVEVLDSGGVDRSVHFLSSTISVEENKNSVLLRLHSNLLPENQNSRAKAGRFRSGVSNSRQQESKASLRINSALTRTVKQDSQEKGKGTGPLQILKRSIKVGENFAIHPLREKSVILSKTPSSRKAQYMGNLQSENMPHAYNYILGAAKKFVDINLPSLSSEKPRVCKIAMEKSTAVITCHVPTALFEGLHYDCETIGEASQTDRMQQ